MVNASVTGAQGRYKDHQLVQVSYLQLLASIADRAVEDLGDDPHALPWRVLRRHLAAILRGEGLAS